MANNRPSNRSYSNEKRTSTTPLVLAVIVLVTMVGAFLIATRDKVGVDRPAPPVQLPLNR